jgi:hypothetical protein
VVQNIKVRYLVPILKDICLIQNIFIITVQKFINMFHVINKLFLTQIATLFIRADAALRTFNFKI